MGLRPWRAADALTLVTRILLVGAGLLVTLAGVVFTLQGVGVIGGSFMSGTNTWAVAGPVIALAGLALVAAGLLRGQAGHPQARPSGSRQRSGRRVRWRGVARHGEGDDQRHVEREDHQHHDHERQGSTPS